MLHETGLSLPRVPLHTTSSDRLLEHNRALSHLGGRPHIVATHLLLREPASATELATRIIDASGHRVPVDGLRELDKKLAAQTLHYAKGEDPYLQGADGVYGHAPAGKRLYEVAGLVVAHWLQRPDMSPLYEHPEQSHAVESGGRRQPAVGSRLAVLDALRVPGSTAELDTRISGLSPRLQAFHRTYLRNVRIAGRPLVAPVDDSRYPVYQIDPELQAPVEELLAEVHALNDPEAREKLQGVADKITQDPQIMRRLTRALLAQFFGPLPPERTIFSAAPPHTAPPAANARAQRAAYQRKVFHKPVSRLEATNPKDLIALNALLEHFTFNPRTMAIHLVLAMSEAPLASYQIGDGLIAAAAPDLEVATKVDRRAIQDAVIAYMRNATDNERPYFSKVDERYVCTARGKRARAVIGRQAMTWLDPLPATERLYPIAVNRTSYAHGYRMAVLQAFLTVPTTREVNTMLNAPEAMVRNCRSTMLKEGLLIKSGGDKNATYEVDPDIRPDLEQTLAGLHDLTISEQRKRLTETALRIGGDPDIFRSLAATALRNILSGASLDKRRRA